MLSRPSRETSEIVKQCLHATVEGPFFPEWEFQILFGVNRDLVKNVYESWPEQSVSDDDFKCAVVGSVNNLLGYPHYQQDILAAYVAASPDQMRRALNELIDLGF